ncbi:MAG: Ferredoxin-2 [Synergistetes bacterium ADurb.Bin155]|nr:4Fe-4S binding protein [Synergistales bacterium]NMD17430.1 4Fe-4S binding protein [Synergistaceae bacterium]OQB45970.1 MAG: Ferredoxin-2 [Synergistetes bacterium ADurb.Bin155]MBP8995224.1 4Fe-4S binding protein [Synergistales bacterium]HOC81759.1 4Fe-4S binding protein [Synergistales bacterium]
MPKKFMVTVDPRWCKGCGLCLAVCPTKVFDFDEGLKSVPTRMEDCIGCKQCENICPDLAITVEGSADNAKS